MTTLRRMGEACNRVERGESPHGTFIEELADEADRMVAEAIAARRIEVGGNPLAALAKQMRSDSETWFPEVHDRDDHRILLHYSMGLAGESGEVIDVVKKIDAGRYEAADDELPNELADVFTYLLVLADHVDVDLIEAYEAKRQHNINRFGPVTR